MLNKIMSLRRPDTYLLDQQLEQIKNLKDTQKQANYYEKIGKKLREELDKDYRKFSKVREDLFSTEIPYFIKALEKIQLIQQLPEDIQKDL